MINTTLHRILFLFLVSMMALSLLSACDSYPSAEGNTPKTQTQGQSVLANQTSDTNLSTVNGIRSEREYAQNDPAAVLDEITNDFSDITTLLTQKLAELFTDVGTTYADYQKNKGLIDEWIDLVLTESDNLFSRTKVNSIAYFKLVAADPDHKYREFCEEALDNYYNTVYDDAMDDYYDSLYDDAMDDLYDQYYDGILDDAYKSIEYEEWSDASSECYKIWSSASSAIYQKWSSESSYIYGLWSAMNSAFCWNDNYDVDAIIKAYEQEKAEKEKIKAENRDEEKESDEFSVNYNVLSDGKAEVVGYSGEGNQITINSEYDGHEVIRISEEAFKDCTMLESIIIWANLEEIADSAFKGCTGLVEISIPSDTTRIGNHAFEGCTKLENVIIWGNPDIGDYAFSNCISLTSISIGSDTKSIGAHAFEGCTSVTSLIIWGVDTIGDYAFAGCSSIESVSIPSDVKSIGNHAFDGCTSLSSVIIWDDDTAIGKDAFANCPNLTKKPMSRGSVPEYIPQDQNNLASINTTEATQDIKTPNGMRPEFKEAMDSYEDFYNGYCDFMKKYRDNPTDLKLLADYTVMVSKLADMDEKFAAWESEDLNSTELIYYLEVNNRILQKIVEAAQ